MTKRGSLCIRTPSTLPKACQTTSETTLLCKQTSSELPMACQMASCLPMAWPMANVRHLTPPKARLKQQSVSFSHFSSIQHINRGTYTSLYPRITSPTSHPLVPFAAAVTFVSAIFIFPEVAILSQRPEKIPWACWTCCIYDAKKWINVWEKVKTKLVIRIKNAQVFKKDLSKYFSGQCDCIAPTGKIRQVGALVKNFRSMR